MKSHRAILSWFCLTIFLLGPAGCGAATDSYGRKVVGGINVKEEESRGPLPNGTPRTIYLADFALEAESYSADEGVRGALPGRLGHRLPHPLGKDNPSERVRQIVETMAESLVQDLRAKGMTAQRLPNTAGNLPQEGWLVQGFFTERDDQENRRPDRRSDHAVRVRATDQAMSTRLRMTEVAVSFIKRSFI